MQPAARVNPDSFRRLDHVLANLARLALARLKDQQTAPLVLLANPRTKVDNAKTVRQTPSQFLEACALLANAVPPHRLALQTAPHGLLRL